MVSSNLCFENADYNFATIHFIHSIDSTDCVTPAQHHPQATPKPEKQLSQLDVTGNFDKVSVSSYKKPQVPGVSSTGIKPLQQPDPTLSDLKLGAAMNNFWMALVMCSEMLCVPL